MKIWPTPKLGQAAASLTLLFILLMMLKMGALGIRFMMPLPSPLIALLGIAGLVFGLLSIYLNKDKAILTWLSIPIGLIIFFWIGAEIMFPH